MLNFGTETISLDGVSIADFAGEPYVLPSGLNLAAGERIVVARNPADFDAYYGTSINRTATGYANRNLSNGGELISLVDAFGTTLQAFTYDNAAPWPTAPDGQRILPGLRRPL